MNRSRLGHLGARGSRRSTAPYNTATMSAIERTAPMCELPPRLVIRNAWIRMRRASSRVSIAVSLNSLCLAESPNARADVIHVLQCDHRIQRQHQTSAKEALRLRQRHAELESGKLVDCLPTPLHQCTNAVRGQIGAQSITVIGLNLIVLEDVEMIRVAIRCRRQLQLRKFTQALLVTGRQRAPVCNRVSISTQLQIENGRLQVVETRVEAPHDDITLAVASRISEQQQPLRHGVIVRYDGTSIPKTAKDLCRI